MGWGGGGGAGVETRFWICTIQAYSAVPPSLAGSHLLPDPLKNCLNIENQWCIQALAESTGRVHFLQE